MLDLLQRIENYLALYPCRKRRATWLGQADTEILARTILYLSQADTEMSHIICMIGDGVSVRSTHGGRHQPTVRPTHMEWSPTDGQVIHAWLVTNQMSGGQVHPWGMSPTDGQAHPYRVVANRRSSHPRMAGHQPNAESSLFVFVVFIHIYHTIA